jgi:hypothetical protein
VRIAQLQVCVLRRGRGCCACAPRRQRMRGGAGGAARRRADGRGGGGARERAGAAAARGGGARVRARGPGARVWSPAAVLCSRVCVGAFLVVRILALCRSANGGCRSRVARASPNARRCSVAGRARVDLTGAPGAEELAAGDLAICEQLRMLPSHFTAIKVCACAFDYCSVCVHTRGCGCCRKNAIYAAAWAIVGIKRAPLGTAARCGRGGREDRRHRAEPRRRDYQDGCVCHRRSARLPCPRSPLVRVSDAAGANRTDSAIDFFISARWVPAEHE